VEDTCGLGLRTWKQVGLTKPRLPFVAKLAELQGAEKSGKKGKEQTQLAQWNAHEELSTKWLGA